ncbi:MAG: alanine racemase [Lachnospiraceae bacterium]|nr:alanine racemase [Lachnospiraceae bacterium]
MSKERVYAKIDLNHIVHNLECMHDLIRENTKIIAVIKANGYGHGAVRIAQRTESLPYLHGFAVATAEEAFELREHGIKKPILILGYTFPEDYERLIREQISLCVFKEETAEALNENAMKPGLKAKVHLKVDTGMSRIGVPSDASGVSIAGKIASYPNLEMEGVMTHFARADETDKQYAKKQYERFCAFIDDCEKNGVTFTYRHCSNSAGIMELPEVNMDIVRCGITLYGLMPSDEVRKDIPLKPGMTLHSRIVHIKELPAGVQISYGGTFTTERDRTKVATIPVGYADGYPRTLSSKGSVLIRGRRAPIIGRICMDQMMVDVTDIPGVKDYDEVVLIGEMGNERITAEELGALSGRFNYELVCDISERVPRVFVG